MKSYNVNGEKMFFDNAKFIEIMDEKYRSIKFGCTQVQKAICKYTREKLEDELCKDDFRRVYSWYHPQDGRFVSPNTYELVEALAAVLGVEPLSLLRKNPYYIIESISNKDINECDNMSPVELLIKIVMSYDVTYAYNYISSVDDDNGLDYWVSQVRKARRRIELQTEDSDTIKRRLLLCDDFEKFIEANEYADGLSDRFFEVNPKLLYFTSPYELMEESMELFVKSNLNYLFIPSLKEIVERYNYFKMHKAPDCEPVKLFKIELATAVRRRYQNTYVSV